ncbi:MAG TPA: hypothetical protein VHB48_09630, partial [Chitinophagaceae bacterium]|nr:hypothetical protein [Chitinophagaceae bacterium]
NGLFSYGIWTAFIAGISIILAAVYSLNMVQKIFYGRTMPATEYATDASGNIQFVLVLLAVAVLVLGVYPQPVISLTHDSVQAVLPK